MTQSGPRPFASSHSGARFEPAPLPGPRDGVAPDLPAGAARMNLAHWVRTVTEEEATEFGFPAGHPCLVVERVFYNAAGGVLQSMTTVDFSGGTLTLDRPVTDQDRERNRQMS